MCFDVYDYDYYLLLKTCSPVNRTGSPRSFSLALTPKQNIAADKQTTQTTNSQTQQPNWFLSKKNSLEEKQTARHNSPTGFFPTNILEQQQALSHTQQSNWVISYQQLGRKTANKTPQPNWFLCHPQLETTTYTEQDATLTLVSLPPTA